MRITSLTAVVLASGGLLYELIERDSLTKVRRPQGKKVTRYAPMDGLAVSLIGVALLVFLIKLTIYERPTSTGTHYYITGIVDPISRPGILPKTNNSNLVQNWELESYLDSVDEKDLNERIIQVYGRFPVAFSWTSLFFIYVVSFTCLSGSFSQLAVREFLKHEETTRIESTSAVESRPKEPNISH